jgi:hypothetical protein
MTLVTYEGQTDVTNLLQVGKPGFANNGTYYNVAKGSRGLRF